MTDTLFEIKNVSFRYNGEEDWIIDKLSFNINRGGRLALRGESGTGKTTIFRLLLGFEQPDKGNIFYKSHSLDTCIIRQIRKEAAWLPQDLNLGSGQVKELLLFPFQFKANELSKPETAEIVDIFEQLGLSGSLLNKKFDDLSTGQRQRVGIALCYLLDKPLILLDEPTSALDKASKQKVIDLLFKDSTRTILSTSHDPWWIKQCQSVVNLET